MDKQSIINLTNNVYRLTLLFPKKEPLRYKMREIASDILAKCSTAEIKHNPVATDLEIIDRFFEVAKAQNWVKAEELLAVQKEYGNLKREINKLKLEKQLIEERPEVGPRGAVQSNIAMPERQERILAFLREQGRAQVWHIKEVMPEVTKRTLRRDFDALLKQGLVERVGERNNTFYQIKTA